MPNEDPGGEPRLRAASTELQQTRVAASLAAPIEPKTNVLCAGTFGLAWRALEEHAGAPVEVEGAPSFAGAVRASACDRADLDDASHVARAVVGPEGLADLAAELAEKVGAGAAPRLLPRSLPPDTLLVYAYLFKHLALATPLARDELGELSFCGRPAVSFGVWDSGDTALWEKRSAQVRVLDHVSDQDFVIELVTRAAGDRLILARIPPGPTLEDTVNTALSRAPEEVSLFRRLLGGSRLKRGERFQAPVLDFEIAHRFAEIEDRRVAPLDRPLARAEQLVRLRLDEHGALLKSEMALELPKGRAARLRSFVIDGPFLVLMIRRGARRPYLALWVSTPELVVPVRR